MRSDLENRITVSSTARSSSAEALRNAPDLSSTYCASNENSCFKENINTNKSETPKLSLEPRKMKRKKNGGGYNLRNSLAWDRAFFTEEGILDPLELSTINDVSCRENEDFGKDRKKDWSSPKLDSSSSHRVTSTSLTSHRFETHLGSKPGSRCGDCPRPLTSPSKLKRPANVNVGKAAGKELKLPKVHGLKPGSSPTCTTTRSTILRTNCVKHNQIAQPDFSIQRHAEPKCSSKFLKNTQHGSRATPQSAQYSDRNSGNSSLKRHAYISTSTAMVDKTDSLASKFSDNATPIRPEMSTDGQTYDSTAFEAPISESAHIIDKTVHPLQSIMAKPTGLRIPSPSLSFFSQPKPLVYRDFPQKNKENDVFGYQKPGNLRLQDNLRMPNLYSIQESTISSSKAVNSKTGCMTSSHISAIELIKPNFKKNPTPRVGVKVLHDALASHPTCNKIFGGNNIVLDGQIQDLPQKNVIARISHEAELQKIGIELPSQIESCESSMDKFLKDVDGYPVKSGSCGSRWRNAELGSEQNYAIQECETISAIDEPTKEKNTCNILVLNHGSTHCTDEHENRVLNILTAQCEWRKINKQDCHVPHKKKTAPLKYSVGETGKNIDEDKNVLKKKERASEQLVVSQKNGSCCSGSCKPLEQRQIKTENPYFGSKHQYADLPKGSASLEVLTDNLPSREPPMQNSVFASAIEGCENDINSMLEAANNIEQPCKSSEVENICHEVEMELEITMESNASDRLPPGKPISFQNSPQEESDENLLFVVPDGKDGDEVIGCKMPASRSLARKHDSNLRKEKIISKPLRDIVFDSVDSLSPESGNSLINTVFDCNDKHQGNANVLLKGAAREILSCCIHQDTQRTEIGNCSTLPQSRIQRLSQMDTLEKVTVDGQSDTDSLRDSRDTWIVVVQSPESNMLNDHSSKKSECMAIVSDGVISKNRVHSNDSENALGSTENYVTSQDEIYLGTSKNSDASVKESPSEHNCSNDAHGTGDHIADAVTDPSRAEPFSDTIKDEVSDETNSPFNGVRPKPDRVKVEAALAPNNKHENGLNEKSRLLALPQYAIPFSDEWLAAIEAAGEDILTRKSGAVQNSPPEKTLPEPSPWSPVKRKNNQIGPFDCTKFTAPSDSLPKL